MTTAESTTLDLDAAITARRVADGVAARAGVHVGRAGTVEELQGVLALIDEIWQPDPQEPPITFAVLRALVHSGAYCAVASVRGHAVGASIGFLGQVPPQSLHSHITGVTRHAAGHGVGFALKLDQRAWALERGLATVTWTFDPLIRRNAFFNTVKLGAAIESYAEDFYGEIGDAINAGQGSDRLLVRWDLLAPAVVAATAGRTREPDPAIERSVGATVAVSDTGDGPSDPVPVHAGTALVQVPPDVEQLREESPALAARWRSAVRTGLGGQLAAGWTVTGASRSGWYVLAEPLPREERP